MTTYTATFEGEKIGRRQGVKPYTCSAKNISGFAHKLTDFAGGYLASRTVDVEIYEDGIGDILVGGWRQVGKFTWTSTEDDPIQDEAKVAATA
jgi:hypothetical protein